MIWAALLRNRNSILQFEQTRCRQHHGVSTIYVMHTYFRGPSDVVGNITENPGKEVYEYVVYFSSQISVHAQLDPINNICTSNFVL